MNAHALCVGFSCLCSGIPVPLKQRVEFHAYCMKDKNKFSLENTLSLAKVVKISTPKNMLIENETLLKFKNLVTDYPEYNLSPTKLLNVIALN